MERICPTKSRLLLRLDKRPRSFAGGLIIAQVPEFNIGKGFRQFPKRGTVVAIGPGVQNLDIGDYVLCTTMNGVEVPREFGRDLLLVKEEFVLSAMDEPADIEFGHALEGYPGDRSGFIMEDEEAGIVHER